MAGQIDSNDPSKGFKGEKDFVEKGEIRSDVLTIVDSTNPTKKLAFDVSGVPAGSTVTLTAPAADTALGGMKVARVWEEQNEGTAGGASVSAAFGATAVRVLNQSSDPDSIGLSVASNKITLPAGRYFVRVISPFFQVAACQLRLYDVTNSAVLAYGSTNYSGAGDTTPCVAHLMCGFTLAASADLRIEYHAGAVVATNGLGVPTSGITVSGHKEVYTQVEIVKY